MVFGQSLGLVLKADSDLVVRQAAFRLPRPTPVATLMRIAERFEERLSLGDAGSIHLIGVATGGDQVVAAVSARLALRNPPVPVWLSTINVGKPLNIVASLDAANGERPQTIVFDNAITTGHTMRQVLKLLKGKDVSVDCVVKLVNYRDDLEREATRSLEFDHQVSIVSLFDVGEIGNIADPR